MWFVSFKTTFIGGQHVLSWQCEVASEASAKTWFVPVEWVKGVQEKRGEVVQIT